MSSIRSSAQNDGHCCELMSGYLADEDEIVVHVPKFREYGMRVLDGGSSFIRISFCPWCGHKLPESLRDKWFELLDEMRLEPERAPAEFTTDQWWREMNM